MALDLGKILGQIEDEEEERKPRRTLDLGAALKASEPKAMPSLELPERPKERTFGVSSLVDIVRFGQDFSKEVLREPLQQMQKPKVTKEVIEKDGRQLETTRVERSPFKEAVGGALEGILFPAETRQYRADLRDNPVLGKIAAAGEAIPFIGGAIDAAVIDPLEGTKTGAVRDVGRILSEFILPAAGAASAANTVRNASNLSKVGTLTKAIAPLSKSPAALGAGVAGIQEFQRRGVENPVGSIANVAAAAAGGKLGMKVTDPFVAKAATAAGAAGSALPRQIGRALVAETGVELASGVPAALVNVAPTLERMAAGEEISEQEKADVKSEIVASVISVLGGSLGGVIGGRSLAAEERAAIEKQANDALRLKNAKEQGAALKDMVVKAEHQAAKDAGIPIRKPDGMLRPVDEVISDLRTYRRAEAVGVQVRDSEGNLVPVKDVEGQMRSRITEEAEKRGVSLVDEAGAQRPLADVQREVVDALEMDRDLRTARTLQNMQVTPIHERAKARGIPVVDERGNLRPTEKIEAEIRQAEEKEPAALGLSWKRIDDPSTYGQDLEIVAERAARKAAATRQAAERSGVSTYDDVGNPRTSERTPERSDLPNPEFMEYSSAPVRGEKGEDSWRSVPEVRNADGQLVSPSGKPSKLNERQWKQVRTPEFKEWFGDWENDPKNASKVVDENGEPLVVYHGGKFDEVKDGVPDTTGSGKKGWQLPFGMHFTPEMREAKNYKPARGGAVTEAYINTKNLLYLTPEYDGVEHKSIYHKMSKEMYQSLPAKQRKQYDNLFKSSFEEDSYGYTEYLEAILDKMKPADARALVESMGFDGIVYKARANYGNGMYRPFDAYIAFDPTQIKSSTGNRGTFDPANPDIRYSSAPVRGEKGEESWRSVPEVRDAEGQLVSPSGKPSKLNERQWKQVRTPEFKEWFGDWENDPKNASKAVDENGEPLVVYHGTPFGEIKAFDSRPIYFTESPAEANMYTGVFGNRRDTWGGKSVTSREAHIKPSEIVEGDWYYRESWEPGVWHEVDGALFRRTKDGDLELLSDKEADFDFSTNSYSIRDAEPGAKQAIGAYFVSLKNPKELPWYELNRLAGFGSQRDSQASTAVRQLIAQGFDGATGVSDQGLARHVVAFNPTQIKSATANTGVFDAGNPDIRYSSAPSAEGRLESDTILPRVTNIVKQALGDKAVVFVQNRLKKPTGEPASGAYDAIRNEIHIARNSENPEQAAWHESYHAAEETILSKEDRSKIAAVFQKDSTMHKRLIEAVNNDPSLEKYPAAKQAIISDINSNPKEARSYGFTYWREGKLKAPTALGRAWETVKEFLDRIHSALKKEGFTTGLDVFRSIESGTLARSGKVRAFGAAPGQVFQKAVADAIREASKTTSPRLQKAIARAAQLGLPKGWVHGLEYTVARDKLESMKSHLSITRAEIVSPALKIYDGLNETQKQEFYNIMYGASDVAATLDEAAVKAALDGRAAVDKLSMELVEAGIPSEWTQEVIERGVGTYMVRAYAIDYDKKYATRILKERGEPYDKAAAFLVNQQKLQMVGFDQNSIKVPEGLDAIDQERFIAEALEDAHDIITGEITGPRKFKIGKQLKQKDADGNIIPNKYKEGDQVAPTLTSEQVALIQKAKQIEATEDMGNQARQNLNNLLTKRAGQALRGEGGGQLSMPLQRLLRRSNIPKQLREVYGEITNPVAVLDKTIYDINHMLNKHRFLSTMKDARRSDGRKFFYTKEELPNDPDQVYVQMRSEGPIPGVYGEVTGLWTTRDVKEAFDDDVLGNLAPLVGLFDWATRPFQKAQTVWSTGTQVRNALTNAVLFATWSNTSPFNPKNWKYYRDAWNTTYDALVKGKSSELYKEMAEEGALAKQFFDVSIIGDQVKKSAKAMRRMKDGENPVTFMTTVADKIGGAVRGVDDKLTAFYLMGDQLFRAATYLKHKDVFGGDKAKAANWTNMFNPDYSQIGRIFERYQKTPFASPFMSFWIDAGGRIAINAMLYNPVKFTMVMGATAALFAGLGDILSDDDKERWEKAQVLLPDYHRLGANFAFKGIDGNLTYVNVDNILPTSSNVKMVRQLDPKQIFMGGPVWDSLVTLVSGRDLQGIERYPEDASVLEKVQAFGQVLLKSYTPPLLPGGYEYERLRKGITGEPGARGNVQNLAYAAMSPVSGIRPIEMFWDVAYRQATLEAVRGYSDRIATAKRVIRNPGASAEKKRGYVTELEELLGRMKDKETELREAYEAGTKIGGRQSARKTQNIQDARSSMRARITELRRLIGEARSAK